MLFFAIENALRTETGRIRKATFDVTILGPLDEVFFHGIAPKNNSPTGSPRESLLNIFIGTDLGTLSASGYHVLWFRFGI